MQEIMDERDTQDVDVYVDEDFSDVRKEKDVALTVTPEAKAAFSRKPYYMFTSGTKITKIHK